MDATGETKASAGGDSSPPILEMRGIAKRFGATQALEGVSLVLRAGEIHALLGENGAGKSTLIKIMTGVYQPDLGEILLNGQPISIGNTAAAQRHRRPLTPWFRPWRPQVAPPVGGATGRRLERLVRGYLFRREMNVKKSADRPSRSFL